MNFAMEFLRTFMDGGSAPVLTAFLLGLLTAVSPCPLATNIAAVGFLGRNVGSRRRMFTCGLLYALGRIVAYTALGAALIFLLKGGSSLFGIQKFIGRCGDLLLGPLLLIIGAFMLFGARLPLPKFGFGGGGERLAARGGFRGAFLLGMLFAMAFCPASGVFYFSMLIPMSAASSVGWALPAVFAAATALPVLIAAWILAFCAEKIGTFYGNAPERKISDVASADEAVSEP